MKIFAKTKYAYPGVMALAHPRSDRVGRRFAQDWVI